MYHFPRFVDRETQNGTSAKSEVSRISDEDDDDGEMPSWIRDDPKLAKMVSKCHTHVSFHL